MDLYDSLPRRIFVNTPLQLKGRTLGMPLRLKGHTLVRPLSHKGLTSVWPFTLVVMKGNRNGEHSSAGAHPT
jgi:hypothetical protein